MLDLAKLKFLKILGYVLLLVLAVVIGVGVGQSLSTAKQKENTKETKEEVIVETVTREEVEKFLLNYFTKKDLGENRKRYKEYMTEALYQQTVAIEQEPTNQTYKGFVVDFEFKDADIFINSETHEVIAQVSYVNTLLDEKKDYDRAQRDVPNNVVLRLTYVDVNGKMKVNKMESILLSDQTGDYGVVDNTTSTEETGETTGETTTESNASTEGSSTTSAETTKQETTGASTEPTTTIENPQ